VDLSGHERSDERDCQTFEILNPMNGDIIDIEVDLAENEAVKFYSLRE